MEKVQFDTLKNHLYSLSNGKSGEMKKGEAKDLTMKSLGGFAQFIQDVRKGTAETSTGRKTKPYDLSFAKACQTYYGCTEKGLFEALGIHTSSMSIEEVSRELGFDNINKKEVVSLLIEHSKNMSFGVGGAGNTSQVNSTYRFLIPEIMTAAIRYGYEHNALYQNWVGTTVNMANRKLTMPQILRGDTSAAIIGERGDIPLGSVNFGRKDVSVFKVGTGFDLSDELIIESSIDLLSLFLQEVGNDMAISADVKALDVLLNGEQLDGSESAPVVGVGTTGQFQYKDLKRVFTRMTRLNNSASRIIASEDSGIDITAIDRFEGFNGDTRLADIKSIIGVPEKFDIDTHVPPTGQIVFVNPNAMAKLSFRGLMFEQRRNPKNQTEETYVSDHLGFAIVKRDARVVLDKTISYAGFPSYMDIDGRISQAFKTLSE